MENGEIMYCNVRFVCLLIISATEFLDNVTFAGRNGISDRQARCQRKTIGMGELWQSHDGSDNAGRSGLLRGFKEETLLKKHEESLVREDERLERMEEATTCW